MTHVNQRRGENEQNEGGKEECGKDGVRVARGKNYKKKTKKRICRYGYQAQPPITTFPPLCFLFRLSLPPPPPPPGNYKTH